MEGDGSALRTDNLILDQSRRVTVMGRGNSMSVISLTDPDGGIRTTTYDLDGGISVFQDTQANLTSYTWDAASRKTRTRYGEGLRAGYGYNATGQILTIQTDNGASTLFTKFTFLYDPNGNRTVIKDLDTSLTTYSYDAKNRLTEDKTSGANAHDYTYTYL